VKNITRRYPVSYDELIFNARQDDLNRRIATKTVGRVVDELYGECRCAPQPATAIPPCEKHRVDPGLFRRFVWFGLGS
jgi:hypothetical protein